jgi:FAD/FMN-containing dehydrogenase
MIRHLLDIVGPRGLITDEAEMRPYLTDWRGRKQSTALCAVLPASTQEVAAVEVVAIIYFVVLVPLTAIVKKSEKLLQKGH